MLILTLALPADHPVLDAGADPGRQGLEGAEREELALAGMEPADGQHDQLVRPGRRPFRDDGEVRAQRAGGERDLFRGLGEMGDQQLLGVVAQRADARGAADEPPGEPAPPGPPGKLQDLGAVEGQDEPPRPECVEELQQHQRQHRTRLRQVDRGVAQPAAVPDQLARQLHLAPEIVGALQRQPPEPEGPGLLDPDAGRLRPDLDVVAQVRAGAGDLLGKSGDAAPDGEKFVGDQENWRCRPGGSRGVHHGLVCGGRGRLLSQRVPGPAHQ